MAITVSASEKNTIEIFREYSTNQIMITGQIPIGNSTKEWISVKTQQSIHCMR